MVVCEPPAGAVANVTLQTFEDADTARASWRSALRSNDTAKRVDDACPTDPGDGKWGFGHIACLVDGDTAQLRWTDSRIGLYGQAEGTSDDISSLYEWWRSDGRRIGRAGATAEAETGQDRPEQDPPKTTKPKKLVRVPGSPKALICGDSATIPDEWDRTWRLKTVNFRNRAGYERVVLNLERMGKNRTKWPTQAAVERMALSQVTKAVPNAFKPKRGASALVVRLDGVRDAPNLYHYRPNDLARLKEVSVVKDGAGRAVVLTVAPGTCYQMRIPVWGSNATGNEGRAEVYIDLRQK